MPAAITKHTGGWRNIYNPHILSGLMQMMMALSVNLACPVQRNLVRRRYAELNDLQ